MLENTTDVFRESIADLALPDDAAPENCARKATALANLAERVEQLDLAVALRNLGGVPRVVACLSSQHAALRTRAADVIAISCHNHPELQVPPGQSTSRLPRPVLRLGPRPA